MSARSIRRAAERKAAKKSRQSDRDSFSHPIDTSTPSFPEPGHPFPALSEISPARLAANQANAQLSSGPRTDEGKAVSSQNRVSHGLSRHNGAFALLPEEDTSNFDCLLAELRDEHQPATPTESILVSAMAESYWLRNRALRLQAACFDQAGDIVDTKKFSLYMRYEAAHNRVFHKSLGELLKLRADRRKAALGFEAQKIKNEAHAMKKQGHYWDVLRKDAEACHQIAQSTLQKMDATKQHPGFVAQFDQDLKLHGLDQGQFGGAGTDRHRP